MNFSTTANGLTIYLGGRIDTDNAEQISAELTRIRGENPNGSVSLDAQALQSPLQD